MENKYIRTKRTTKSRHTDVGENWSFCAVQYLPTASAIHGPELNPETLKWEHADAHEETIRLYWPSLWIAELLAHNGNQYGRNFQTGLADWVVVWADFFYFLYMLLLSVLKNPGFIPAYPMTFISMLGQFWFFLKILSEIASAQGAEWPAVCLLHQHSFCHIHRECCLLWVSFLSVSYVWTPKNVMSWR
jgi:hypothetical protein